MSQTTHTPHNSTVDPAEIERFSRIADEWWDPTGKFAPLHRLDPVRIGYIRDRAAAHWRPRGAVGPAAEGPLRARHRLRRRPAQRADGAAGRHGHRRRRLGPQYRRRRPPCRQAGARDRLPPGHRRGPGQKATPASTSCWRSRSSSTWPTSTCSCRSCGRLVKPGGLLFLSTLNRTAKAWALAIAGAEYVLGWLPRGTHDWKKFLKPSEVVRGLEAGGIDHARRSWASSTARSAGPGRSTRPIST